MTTLFEDIVPPGVSNLRMGAPGDKILLKSAELVKNAAQKVMVSTSIFNIYHVLVYGERSILGCCDSHSVSRPDYIFTEVVVWNESDQLQLHSLQQCAYCTALSNLSTGNFHMTF